jgi:histidinol-phosphatase (PHP family)
MKYYDYHIHSEHSFDGVVSIDKICSTAQQMGMAGLTLTEHVEFAGLYDEDIMPDFPQYVLAVQAARKAYPDLQIGMGIEMGLQPDCGEKAQKICQVAEWDFIIGSSHSMHGFCLHNEEFARGKSKDQCWHEYFLGLRQLIEKVHCFDVLGHLDLLRRGLKADYRDISYEEYKEDIDALLLTLITLGKGIEVNTAALRYDLSELHPIKSILCRYRQLGGEIITCGSDAHWQQSICRDIDKGYEYIKEAGFKYISLFEKRKLRQLPL